MSHEDDLTPEQNAALARLASGLIQLLYRRQHAHLQSVVTIEVPTTYNEAMRLISVAMDHRRSYDGCEEAFTRLQEFKEELLEYDGPYFTLDERCSFRAIFSEAAGYVINHPGSPVSLERSKYQRERSERWDVLLDSAQRLKLPLNWHQAHKLAVWAQDQQLSTMERDSAVQHLENFLERNELREKQKFSLTRILQTLRLQLRQVRDANRYAWDAIERNETLETWLRKR
ncbi:hypothetical protein [Deinococcus sp.]|uniref:hypothetical protein n=1 Tax=Deinococcus sp. TaxID=47478 RepID=UPI003CC5B83C